MRFNFLDWMSMNMAVDIAFLIFTIAFVWKLRSVMKYAENLSLQTLKIKKELENKKIKAFYFTWKGNKHSA